MNVDLIVPLSPGDPERDAAWEFVSGFYERMHPGLTVTVGRDTEGWWERRGWSKGYAIADGAKSTSASIMVIADADVIVSPEALGYSIIAVMNGAAWSMPHGDVYRLSRRATNDVVYLKGETLDVGAKPPLKWTALPPHPGPPGGGIVVLTRSAYETVGGVDPRFVGFGGDDISFARALDTLVGPCERFNYPMTHLYHERTPRRKGNRGSAANEALAARYMLADGDKDAMRAIVAEFKVTA
jgi:hypothetical protein